MSSVHVSNMVGKLEGFKAISTNTVTNDFCIKQNSSNGKANNICKICYSHGMLKSYRKNMQPSLQRNSDLLSSRPLEKHELPTFLDAFLRINAHGELINLQHFENICAIAEHNPHCNVALWTKRRDIVAKYYKQYGKFPANLILVWSNSEIDKIKTVPPLFHKVFNNVSHDKFVEQQNCTGQKCKDCLACYKFDGANVIVEATKLNGRVRKD